MYKVLIADDEDIICRGLAGMVATRPELEVAALAEDGEIALEKAIDTRPDLMLVDINMPFLDGLEFIERVRAALPDVLIIIVTGYDDFAFVQKALQLGVADYVLKPVMEQSFFEVLDKAVRRLDSMDTSKRYIDWMERWVVQNRPKLIDDFLDDLLRGRIDESEAEKQMGYLKIRVPVPYEIWILHIYRANEWEVLQEEAGCEAAWYLACREVVQACFAPYSEILCIQTEEGAVAVIAEVLSGQQRGKLERALMDEVRERLEAELELARGQGESLAGAADVFRTAMESYKERAHYSDIVLRAIAIIQSQWGDSALSLGSVADTLFVSASYLSRMFHRETGENFAAFLTRKRISEARSFLKDTDMKMYEIAQRTGYTSQHYFSNAFKKAMGLSPADYRKGLLERGGAG